MATFTLQAEFSPFPDNTVLGPVFTLAAFAFKDKGSHHSFVNISGTPNGPGVKGLQFGSAGVLVHLPISVDRVVVRAAAFAPPPDADHRQKRCRYDADHPHGAR
jgi:hypothetical protein